jgi:hypothetical protein
MRVVRPALSASVYAGFGALIMVVTNFLWSDSWAKMGLTVAFQAPFLESVFIGLLGLGIITIVMSLTISALIDKKKEFFVISLVAAFLTLAFYYFTTVATLLSKYSIEQAFLGSFWSIIFGFINGGIIGCSLYLHLTLQKRAKMTTSDRELEIESLKLEHHWFLTAFTSTSYAIMIFVASAVLVSWTQIPVGMTNSIGIHYLFLVTVIQLVYIGIGLWIGVVGKLLGYSLRIHKRMRELKSL